MRSTFDFLPIGGSLINIRHIVRIDQGWCHMLYTDVEHYSPINDGYHPFSAYLITMIDGHKYMARYQTGDYTVVQNLVSTAIEEFIDT